MRGRLERAVRRRALSESVRLVPGVPWSQMPGVYAAADLFALPCRTRLHGLEPEAFGLAFLEAAASGLPVIAGASGGVPETVLDGRTGYLVDARDPGAVGERVSMLLSDPQAARTWVPEGADRYASSTPGRAARVLAGLLEGAGP